MDYSQRPLPSALPAGMLLAPLHPGGEDVPLRICLVLQAEAEAGSSPFILLRDVLGSRVYLGAVCDVSARIQEWVEIWAQELELRDVAFSNHQEPLDNASFDLRWRVDSERWRQTLPDAVISTGSEDKNPAPLLIELAGAKGGPLAKVEPLPWRVCKDDALLGSFGLPAYSASSHRYLYEPAASKPKVFIPTAADSPLNNHTQPLEQAVPGAGSRAVFNRHGGLLRVTRFTPLSLEEYFQILEGRPWEGPAPQPARLFPGSVYAELQNWSTTPKGLPFLLHSGAGSADRLNEIFFLKLSALLELFRAVRGYVQGQQLPLLNLTPASFRVSLPEVGGQFPALWAARCTLAKPGQAYPLKIRFTEQKYFVRLGKTEPSPFLPEGLGAHSFGVGSVRVRNVVSERDGIVLEGTLVAEDYLGLGAHDMLWFKLPLGEERLEFYAHVYTSEIVGPKEARFRTVPTQHPEPVIASLKRATGTAFQRSPYEVWPLLSSPCDLFSLAVITTRALLANSQSNLPVILDETLSLAQHFSKDSSESEGILARLKTLADKDPHVLDLISPHALVESSDSPHDARSKIHMELWLETIALLVRMFPGVGPQSYCKSFGDVNPLALESVFDRPIQELEAIAVRLRSALLPTVSMNEEVARVLLEQLRAG